MNKMKITAALAWGVGMVAAGAFAKGWNVNYDETKIAPYTLEDPLVFADGTRLKSAADWPRRRAEIVDIFAKEMYGRIPPAPEAVVTELKEEGPTLAGMAIRRQYRMWFKKDKTGPFVDWLVIIPNRIQGQSPKKDAAGRVICENKEKCPVMLMLNYCGNHSILNDKEVFAPPPGTWMTDSYSQPGDHEPKEELRGKMRDSQFRAPLPVEMICARGYALMTACYTQISPDRCHDFKAGKDGPALNYTGVFDLWPKREEGATDNITSLGAWAWAMSRGLDFAFTISEIDAKRNVATGYSRLAKTPLLACSRDERFAVCIPNQTGGGGCPLAKRDYGESVFTEVRNFPHWYCRAYDKYSDNEQAMKFDQHLLLASIAPRPLLVQGFNSGWFDTKGEYLAVKAASSAWKFLGKKGLPEGDFPANFDTSLIGPDLGYVRRGGEHGINGYDWVWTLDFADRALGR